MQEAELKKKEKRRAGIEKGKQRWEGEKPKEEKRELVIAEKPKVEKPAKGEIALKPLKISSLQTKPFKEIKTKIKAFFTEIPEIKPTKREIPKISIETKPFGGVKRKILAFNITIPPHRGENYQTKSA